MYYVVTTERLKEPARRTLADFARFQREFDQYLRSRGWRAKSIRHFVTVVGTPVLETWEEYADLADFERDRELLKQLGDDPLWNDLNQQYDRFLERLETRIVEPFGA
jgi:NifB/MoaA-like Fe-S oxidoreductase